MELVERTGVGNSKLNQVAALREEVSHGLTLTPRDAKGRLGQSDEFVNNHRVA